MLRKSVTYSLRDPIEKYNQPMRARFPVTVHLLFFREDQVLLLRRFNTGYADGQYSVPAGHLDGDETVIAAAAREALEETGLRLEPEELVFSSVMHRIDGEERVDFFIRVRSWDGEPENTEPDKCDELRWVSVHDLPDSIIPYVRKAIQNHHDGIRFGEFGW
jgi:8-oxo-dGTP diphosphatase